MGKAAFRHGAPQRLLMFVLDSGAVTDFASRTQQSAARFRRLRQEGGPQVVPSVVLVECLTGDSGRDAQINRFLKTCVVVEDVPEHVARNAARLRTLARRGSAVDALIVALASPGGTILTADLKDIEPLAAHAENVAVERI